jgi:hypothetical protein
MNPRWHFGAFSGNFGHPMRLRSVLLPPSVLALAVAAMAAMNACAGQGEGERCDHRNGDTLDCQSGLTCQNPPAAVVTNPYGICCPPSLSAAKTAACSANGVSLDANPEPPDASLLEASTPEASIGPGPDATADTAPLGADGGVADATADTAPVGVDGSVADTSAQ